MPAAAWEERWSTPSSQGRLSTLDVSKNRLKWLPSRLVEALNIFSYVIIKGRNYFPDRQYISPYYYPHALARVSIYIRRAHFIHTSTHT